MIELWKNPWTVWIGFRYLKSKKNSKFLSFITILSILGVGLGVTSMIVVLSVMDGFETELKKRMMSTDLHVLVQPNQKTPGFEGGFVPSQALDMKKLEAIQGLDQIRSIWPVTSTEVILKAGKKVAGVVFKGVPPGRLDLLKNQLIETVDRSSSEGPEAGGGAELPRLYVGQELAYELGLLPGDPITLISPTEVEGPMEGIPRLKRYVIEGIYRSGLAEQELHTLFASEDAVRSFLRKRGVVSQWEVSVKNFDQAPAVANEIRKLAPDFKVQDWMQLNSHLFASLRLERISMFIILAFIVVVASFNIVTTLTLMVLEKKKEISILKAMGAEDAHVSAIFLSEGLLIGALGVGGGALLGFVICSLLKKYEFITLPEIYYDRTLPVTFTLSYYIGVSVSALLIVLAACIYPSRRAARIHPLEGIRFG